LLSKAIKPGKAKKMNPFCLSFQPDSACHNIQPFIFGELVIRVMFQTGKIIPDSLSIQQ